jgi:hypothetical protein
MKAQNFVAKNAHLAGRAGAHSAKHGKHVKRAIVKHLVRREVQEQRCK